jgi:hypothetical protein
LYHIRRTQPPRRHTLSTLATSAHNRASSVADVGRLVPEAPGNGPRRRPMHGPTDAPVPPRAQARQSLKPA